MKSTAITKFASILALGGALLLTSCGDDESVLVPNPMAPTGTHILGPGGIIHQPDPQLSLHDNVSYWDGDGISGPPSITISLSEQKAYFYKGNTLVGVSRISSGRDGYSTTPGNWKIIQKSKDHRSNLYGDYVDAYGNKVVRDVSVKKDPKPPGTTFLGASMPYFMRFHGGEGMHAGFLPGYAASHGCVRMPDHMAEIFFNNVSVGTPVRVIR
jgi:hypothetical protein